MFREWVHCANTDAQRRRGSAPKQIQLAAAVGAGSKTEKGRGRGRDGRGRHSRGDAARTCCHTAGRGAHGQGRRGNCRIAKEWASSLWVGDQPSIEGGAADMPTLACRAESMSMPDRVLNEKLLDVRVTRDADEGFAHATTAENAGGDDEIIKLPGTSTSTRGRRTGRGARQAMMNGRDNGKGPRAPRRQACLPADRSMDM